MNVVMLANNPCIYDARVIREAEALAAAGHRVCVLATWQPGLARREVRHGVSYHRMVEIAALRQRLAGPAAAGPAPTLARWPLQLAFHLGRAAVTPSLRHLLGFARAYQGAIAALRPDVVHAHDLDTLLAGWLGAKRCGARLIYDAHELETDRNQAMSRLEKAYRALAERLLIHRAAAVITVSDSIADYLAGRYRLARPRVVLNAPATPEATPAAGAAPDLRDDLRLPAAAPLALYIGGMMPGRGIEQAVQALAHLPDLHLAALGPRQDETERRVRRLAESLRVQARLHLVDPVPPEQLEAYIARADVSLVLLQNTCLNHYFCFPNKLLQSLLAGVPVVVARLLELERMVQMTGAGLVADETEPKAIAAAIWTILAKPEAYRPDAALIQRLEASHGWPRQRARLLALYDGLGQAPALAPGCAVGAPQQSV